MGVEVITVADLHLPCFSRDCLHMRMRRCRAVAGVEEVRTRGPENIRGRDRSLKILVHVIRAQPRLEENTGFYFLSLSQVSIATIPSSPPPFYICATPPTPSHCFLLPLKYEHPPPPLPGASPEINLAGVIIQLQKKGNRPHLVRELAAVLSPNVEIV